MMNDECGEYSNARYYKIRNKDKGHRHAATGGGIRHQMGPCTRGHMAGHTLPRGLPRST